MTCECGKNATCQCVEGLPELKDYNTQLIELHLRNPAYGGCTCCCHTTPNVFHCMPCCYPVSQADELLGKDIFNFDSVKLENEDDTD